MMDRPIWGRRLAMPLLALLVAAGLLMWSWWRGPGPQPVAGQSPEVLAFAEGLCADLRLGYDPAPRLAGTDPLIASRLRPRLAEAAQRAGGSPERLRVVVAPGDGPGAGSAMGQATHTAVILVDGQEVLGLRLAAPGGNGPVAIIGFWIE
jgi:hypothetical protein